MYLLKLLIEKWEQRAVIKPCDGLSECIRDAKMVVAQNTEQNWSAKTLDTIIHMKKHRGKTLKEVIEEDPQYINWACGSIEGFYLDETAHNYLIENGG